MTQERTYSSDRTNAVTELDNKLEEFQPEETPDTTTAAETPNSSDAQTDSAASSGDPAMDASFMSESIYEKIPTPSPKNLRHRSISMDLYRRWKSPGLP